MATIILVDRIGEGSRIQELAQEMSGHIVQMGGGYWPTKVAEILRDSVGYKMPKGLQSPHSIRDYLDRHTPSTEELLHFVGL